MSIYYVAIIGGLLFQLMGIVGYLYENRLHTNTESVRSESKIFDNDTGQIISYDTDHLFDIKTWKIEKRK